MQIRSDTERYAAKFARSAALGISVLAALAFAALAASGAAGGPSDLDGYVQALESSYHDVRTLRAEFTQTYTWGARTRVESGTVNFARGGLMRWDYHEPAPKLFLATGKEVYLYIPSENQVTRSSVKSSEDLRVPFRLLLSRLDLRKVFAKIEFADGALEAAPGDRVLRAVPKRGKETYREVLMEVTPNLDIRRLVVSYADRSRMEFDFHRIERNVALDPALFRFTPPQGAEVIKQP